MPVNPQAAQAWRRGLARAARGGVIPSSGNALYILANDPDLDRLLAHNAFTHADLLQRPIPQRVANLAVQPGAYPRGMTDNDVFLIQAYLQVYSPQFGYTTVERAIRAIAVTRSMHPITGWLDGLVWDGIQRLDTWLVLAFGAKLNDYTRAVGSKFMIAAVRRVRSPGAQFDHMPILIGKQGIGKSRSCRTLFGSEWFTDDLPHDFANKDSQQALMGKWGIEMSDIAQLLSRRNSAETVKAYISRPIEHFRPPYGRGFIDPPRQCVFIGTTNKDVFLQDDTGNRRFWPIACKYGDFEWIALNREQLWAEAAAREAGGEAIWLDEALVEAAAVEEQEERYDEDVWEPQILDFLDKVHRDNKGVARTKVATILSDVSNGLAMDLKDQGETEKARVVKVLRRAGWRSVTEKDDKTKKTVRWWRIKLVWDENSQRHIVVDEEPIENAC